MALDQAWAVGGGAENPIEGARLATYAATNGGRGVILPADMKVKALATPGPFVRVVSGACASPNDYLGGNGGGQSYSGREASSTDVPVAPTGSSGSQVKYLIWAIHDEQYEPGLTPADPVNDPRNNYEWVSSTNGLTYPHVPLVRLDQPANTATITGGMLTDIREVANPKTKPDLRTYSLRAEDTETLSTIGSDNTTGETWPRQADTTQTPILIPEWATRVRIVQIWAGVLSPAARTTGRVWLQIGGDGNPNHVKTQTVKYASGPADGRDPIIIADMVWIPHELRGTRQKFIPRGNRESGSGGVMTLDGASAIITQLEFLLQAD